MKKKKDRNISDKRFSFISIIITFTFIIIFVQISRLIIVEGKSYESKLKDLTYSIVEGDSAPRGRIYDRNHNLIVDNKAIPTIVYNKNKKSTVSDELSYAYEISKIIEVDHSKLALINLKEFWIAENNDLANKKIREDEWIKLKNRKLNMTDINNLMLDRITEDDLSLYNDEKKEVAYIYYLMNKGYSYQEKIIKEDNVSDSEYAYIAEHKDSLHGFDVSYNWERVYLYGDTFKSILGSISDITKENKKEYLKKGYSLNDIVGVSYLEKQYEDVLKGTKSKYKLENNKLTLLEEGKRGNDIVLTIDIKLQQKIEKILEEEIIKAKKEPSTKYYNGSYVIIQQPNTGEILAMSGKQVIKSGKTYKVYDITPGILTNPMTPGSVVKGASMIVGYQTNAIKMGEYQTDSCIKIYSKPAKCSWQRLGKINDIQAMAYSSNIYQIKTAMKVDGYKYVYNGKFKAKESTFNTYRKVFNEYGLGVKTGIDLPIESVGNIGINTSSDLLLNFSIGQYDTYTPMQLSQYITTFASNGIRYAPHLLKEVYSSSSELNDLLYKIEPKQLNKVSADKKYVDRVKKGFRAVISYGLGKSIMSNVDGAGKTGTSESFLDTNSDGVVDTETLSNAFVGYAPYKNPVMSITVTSPDLVDPKSGTEARSYVNHTLSRRISKEFFKIYVKK